MSPRPICAYQGGKQRIAGDIVNIMLGESIVDDDTVFYDLCCGSGAITLELINRGIHPERITMLDMSPWAQFWGAISNGTFDMKRFCNFISYVTEGGVRGIQERVKSLSKNTVVSEDVPYVFVILQSSSFGSKAIWLKDGVWQNTSFRSYWEPTPTSSRRSPVNPMMPMPETLLKRVEQLSAEVRGVRVIHGDVRDLTVFPENSVVYIDPPYKNTTSYGYSFDVPAYVQSINVPCFVSEGYKMDGALMSFCIAGVRGKGGMFGERKNYNEEWLNVFE